MGLGFYNEILMAAEQIYPSANDAKRDRNAVEGVRVPNLYNAQGFMALPFVLDMGVSAPPSPRYGCFPAGRTRVPCRHRLVGQQKYAPRFQLQYLHLFFSRPGTSYEVQLFAALNPEEIPRKSRGGRKESTCHSGDTWRLANRSEESMSRDTFWTRRGRGNYRAGQNKLSLGCVNSRPAARGSREAGFTQPRSHAFPSTVNL